MSAFPWKIFRGGVEIYFPEGARRFVSVSVEQIGGDGRTDRAIDGSFIYLGDLAFRQHAVTLSCQGHTVAPVFDLWPGQVVTLEAPVEFAVPGPAALLDYDPVAGSVYGVDEDDNRLAGVVVSGRSVSCPGAVALRYRPVMQCGVASRTSDKTQGRADGGWTIRLEDLSGDEVGLEEGGDTVVFAAPGLQTYEVGEEFSLALASNVSTSTGLPITFAVVAGALPTGLSMTTAGVISGTPLESGVAWAVIQAVSGAVSATQTVPFYAALPTITTTGLVLQEYTVGTPYTLDVSSLVHVENTSEELVFSLPPGSLPAGLSVSSAGVISGTPTEYGAFSATFHVELSTGQSADVTVAFFAQNPDALPDAVILGGTAQTWIESISGGGTTYDAADFTASGVLTVLEAGWIEYILVGGGAGGASVSSTSGGGGGGAGGFRRERVYLPVGTYTVTIGGGGGAGTNGSTTEFANATGVGVARQVYGGYRGGSTTQKGLGGGGASAGGGGGSSSMAGTGGVAIQTDYGSNGGNGSVGTTARGGGGGGFSTAGATPTAVRAGVGGGGIKVRLWEALEFCGGGGGGAGNGVNGSNGLAQNGGGSGGQSGGDGFAAEANTGGGGGGAGGGASGSRTGGAGGSGRAIFIIKRRIAS